MAVRGDNSLFFESGIDLDGLKSGAANATGIVRNLAATIGKLSPFSILATGAATAFAKIGQEAYNMMREFEQAMKEVQTISQAAQKDFEGISSAVFALSKISPDPPAKLAKAYYQIVSSGYDGAEGLKLLEASTKAATAGVTSTEAAADGLTTVLNAFKLEAEDAEKVSDILFTTVRLGKTTIDELSHSLSEVAPLAASSGYNFEEVAAAIATLTKQGVPTSQAMTQIRAAIEATNEVLGDGAAQSMTLQNAFQAIYKEAGGSQNKLKELTGRVEAMSAILAVSGQNARGAQKDLAEYARAAGATTIANQRMLSSNENQWNILNNRIKATTEEVGNAIVEISSNFAGFVNKALESNDRVISSYEQQRIELYKLRGALEETNEESEDFKTIRDQILSSYPEFIGNITKETATTDQLLKVLNQVNEAYILRYKFATRQKELEEALAKQGDTEIKIENQQAKFDEALAALRVRAEDEGITLNINPNLSNQDLIKSIRDQFREAKKGLTDPSGFGNVSPDEGFAESYLRQMGKATGQQSELNKQLTEYISKVEEITQRNRKLSKEELNTAKGREEAIKRINEATKESELTDYYNSGVTEIQKSSSGTSKGYCSIPSNRRNRKCKILKTFS
ncbi:phage tail tape measure protein [Zunongwangia profunda]|uniref:phage tail tape measure protein n=1 Tax=Zunongwangia profunda TaxID=398743 RepID=UPI00248E840E|nr:phage tail tape measure protein [Zunongwangia profunda]